MTNEHSPTPTTEARSSRRNLLRLATAAAATGAAASLLANSPAEATSGAMQYGANNNAGADTTAITSNSGLYAFQGYTGGSGGSGLYGLSSSYGYGVKGAVSATDTTAGVWGSSDTVYGYGVKASGGMAQMMIAPKATAGPSSPNDSMITKGALAYDDTTDGLWVKVSNTEWRVLSGLATAGSFHAIDPSRVYDSRKPSSDPLSTGQNRTVSVANRIDVATGNVVETDVVPAGATAIAYNVTIVKTVGSNGYLAVNPGGTAVVKASIINWFGPGQTAANSSVVKLNASREVTVICGGTSTSTQFIIDVVGYYR
ncbi:MAG: hypothetical protein ABMA25_12370 [Ilumatobacteraceae bacterium]